MKITKYPQSCLLIEVGDKRIVVDPGSFVAEQYTAQDLLPVDAILITHEHADHAHPELIKEMCATKPVPVFANQSTTNVLGDLVTNVVSDGQAFQVNDVHVVARELPHCLLPDGSPGPQNTGYVFDGVFFHPGDGISIEDLKVSAAAVPIAGPDISTKDTMTFIKQLGCETVIPIHYDYYLENPQLVARVAGSVVPTVKFVVLANGQSIDI